MPRAKYTVVPTSDEASPDGTTESAPSTSPHSIPLPPPDTLLAAPSPSLDSSCCYCCSLRRTAAACAIAFLLLTGGVLAFARLGHIGRSTSYDTSKIWPDSGRPAIDCVAGGGGVGSPATTSAARLLRPGSDWFLLATAAGMSPERQAAMAKSFRPWAQFPSPLRAEAREGAEETEEEGAGSRRSGDVTTATATASLNPTLSSSNGSLLVDIDALRAGCTWLPRTRPNQASPKVYTDTADYDLQNGGTDRWSYERGRRRRTRRRGQRQRRRRRVLGQGQRQGQRRGRETEQEQEQELELEQKLEPPQQRRTAGSVITCTECLEASLGANENEHEHDNDHAHAESGRAEAGAEDDDNRIRWVFERT